MKWRVELGHGIEDSSSTLKLTVKDLDLTVKIMTWR